MSGIYNIVMTPWSQWPSLQKTLSFGHQFMHMWLSRKFRYKSGPVLSGEMPLNVPCNAIIASHQRAHGIF